MLATCPCGGHTYAACCGPLHDGADRAATAEQLMRSRYSAFVLDKVDYIVTTWHPRTRPNDVTTGDRQWTGLEIIDAVAGAPHDDEGIVEFVARYVGGEQHERSTFQRRAGRWVYVDAV